MGSELFQHNFWQHSILLAQHIHTSQITPTSDLFGPWETDLLPDSLGLGPCPSHAAAATRRSARSRPRGGAARCRAHAAACFPRGCGPGQHVGAIDCSGPMLHWDIDHRAKCCDQGVKQASSG